MKPQKKSKIINLGQTLVVIHQYKISTLSSIGASTEAHVEYFDSRCLLISVVLYVTEKIIGNFLDEEGMFGSTRK